MNSLAEWLSSLDGARLARVLMARTDAVAPPEPRSLGELADRLQRQGPVALALPRLTRPYLQVTEALAALGAPASRDALAKLLGAADDETTRELDAALEVLADHALVWPDGAGKLRMAAPLRRAWDAPLGLDAPLEELLTGTTSDELRRMLVTLGVTPPGTKPQRLAALVEHHSDPEQIASVVAKAPAAARKLLERRAGATARQPEFIMFGVPGTGLEPGAQWALDRGLLVQDRHRYGPARMPAEVALALRGPSWQAPFEPVPPSVRLVSVTPAEVDREASAAATAFVARAVSVLSACSATAPARLKSGGIGARELARIGKAAQADDAVVRITLEAAYAAGLLGRDGDRMASTDTYDAWAEQEPSEQFAVLLQAWRNLPLTPTLARDEDNKALPALAGAPPCDGCLRARDGLLAAAAQLPAGQGARVTSDLGPLIAWHRPLADSSPQDGTPFAAVIREAELVGVLAHGALSSIGINLRDGDAEGLSIACGRLLPPAVSTARIGADLTAVVTGTPSARLAALLDSVADRETSGTASVWRFSAGGIRRALDAGRVPDDITADLTAVATGPLPQPLSYLIADTARGHGRVRIAPAACVIHGDEPALLAELAAHRGLAKLGLRHLAPTVLVSRSPLDTTLAALRSQGYAPVAETSDGTVRIDKTRPRRATTPVPAPRGTGAKDRRRIAATLAAMPPAAVDPNALATRLLAAAPTSPTLGFDRAEGPPSETAPFDGGGPFATDTEEIVAGWAKRLPYSDVRQLAHAIDTGEAITVDYVATSGNRTLRTLSRLVLDPPYLEAWCHLRDAERVFTLSRIHGVMPG
ncbi:helicase-associated domain-containing protein [Streptomyces sp. NBC_01340]|uniref:helicase-associated domain-containing protein n=1 Tax=unclassified Streptomyces TaxID=2593676 RepID=UPI0022593572|nr:MULTISPECIES: helicase-associated domain-containing protein [unclassified Streptomyces]MCX4455213.1 helicase-associated domain-containing protein [Streptomyces sp. NBC_01719]MCX4494573.1 helicase-associated domain-containing protein [Streptomyces sp. NBC_01728]WSI39624.1 helicase-associated domain-containing protein [Streptomyces sp. NBC_01340]